MADEVQAQEATTDEVVQDTTPAPEAQTADAGQEPGSLDQLPEWAKKLVGDLRKENASHRKAKTQAEKDAEAAARKAAEEQGKYKELYEAEAEKRQAAEAEKHRLEVDAIKARVARAIKLPDALASRLTGETEEEITADAKALLASLPNPGVVLDEHKGTGNGAGQAPVMSQEEINEIAARFGVKAEYIKPENLKLPK